MVQYLNSPISIAKWFASSLVLIGLFLLVATASMAQTTTATGSIQGTITDPSGAAVSGAKVAIIDKGTGQTIGATTNSSGSFTSGALIPGDYTVRVESQGFKASQLPVTVQVGVTSSAN